MTSICSWDYYLISIKQSLSDRLITIPFSDVAGKDQGKASKAAKAVKKSTWKKERKTRYSVVFRRPRTLKRTRDPKYPRIRYVLNNSQIVDLD